MSDDKPHFVDNGSAVDFFANALHSVDRMGPVTRLVFVTYRRTPEGRQIAEPPFTVVVPSDQLHLIGVAIYDASDLRSKSGSEEAAEPLMLPAGSTAH